MLVNIKCLMELPDSKKFEGSVIKSYQFFVEFKIILFTKYYKNHNFKFLIKYLKL